MTAAQKVQFAKAINANKLYKNISFFSGRPPKDYIGKELIQEFNSLQYSISNDDAAKIIENFSKNSVQTEKVTPAKELEESKSEPANETTEDVAAEQGLVEIAQTGGAKTSGNKPSSKAKS